MNQEQHIQGLQRAYRSAWDSHQLIADQNARLLKAGIQPTDERLITEQRAAEAVALARNELIAAMAQPRTWLHVRRGGVSPITSLWRGTAQCFAANGADPAEEDCRAEEQARAVLEAARAALAAATGPGVFIATDIAAVLPMLRDYYEATRNPSAMHGN